MESGASVFLIAVGAILTFALERDLVDGVNLDVVGIILMAVGALGLVMYLAVWAPRRRTIVQRTVVEPPVVERRVYE